MKKIFRSADIFSTYWWALALISAAVVAVTTGMGLWQLDRARQREAIEAGQQANGRLPVLTEKDFEKRTLAEPGLYRRVDVSGRWLGEWTVYLDNRPMHGRPGFWVITPLQLRNGAVFWVQRGWAARDPVSATALPPIETPHGEVQVQGRLIPPPSKLMELQAAPESVGDGFLRIRQNLDQHRFEKETGLEFAATVQQIGAASEGLSRDWPALASAASKNRAYAWQWFALSAVVAGLFMWFQVIRKIHHVGH